MSAKPAIGSGIDSCVDTVAKFFYFASFNEQLSFSASLRVLAELRAGHWLDSEHRSEWVRALVKWRKRLKGLPRKSWSEWNEGSGFIVPDHLDLQSWMNFWSSAESHEAEAVLLSKLLGFSDEEMARGLDVTPGTIRYRVGRGLRQLGGYIEP